MPASTRLPPPGGPQRARRIRRLWDCAGRVQVDPSTLQGRCVGPPLVVGEWTEPCACAQRQANARRRRAGAAPRRLRHKRAQEPDAGAAGEPRGTSGRSSTLCSSTTLRCPLLPDSKARHLARRSPPPPGGRYAAASIPMHARETRRNTRAFAVPPPNSLIVFSWGRSDYTSFRFFYLFLIR